MNTLIKLIKWYQKASLNFLKVSLVVVIIGAILVAVTNPGDTSGVVQTLLIAACIFCFACSVYILTQLPAEGYED